MNTKILHSIRNISLPGAGIVLKLLLAWAVLTWHAPSVFAATGDVYTGSDGIRSVDKGPSSGGVSSGSSSGRSSGGWGTTCIWDDIGKAWKARTERRRAERSNLAEAKSQLRAQEESSKKAEQLKKSDAKKAKAEASLAAAKKKTEETKNRAEAKHALKLKNAEAKNFKAEAEKRRAAIESQRQNEVASENISTSGAFGSKESNAKFASAEPGKTGSNTKAGDQLKSAEAEAAKGSQSDLTINFDVGGAPNAGSLVAAHTLNAGPPPMDLSHFSERAKKDPEIVAGLNNLSELQSKRIELEAQRTQLTKARNLENDRAAQQKKTDLVDQIEKTYQANLTAITEKTKQVEDRHRVIDNAVEATPPNVPNTAGKAGTK